MRETLGTGFPGGTYRQVFYVADIEGGGPALDGELHIDLDEADFLAVFPLAGAGRARLIGTVRDERAEHPEQLRFEDVSARAMREPQGACRSASNWFSTYRVHHRVAAHFGKGRAFLLGDAAHIHSPAGGQGMNTGIGDAVNLAWKLAAVLQGRAPPSLLDSYEAERIPSHAAWSRPPTASSASPPPTVRSRTSCARASRRCSCRGRVAFEPVREFLFRTVSQITVNYRGSPVSAGAVGRVHGGDRLPWVLAGASDNYAALTAISWQVHVYGTAREDAHARGARSTACRCTCSLLRPSTPPRA